MNKRLRSMGGSLGLVVMRGDSRLRRFGLESQHQILDGHFSQYIVIKTCKNCNVCLRNTKNQRKRGQEWPIFIKNVRDQRYRFMCRGDGGQVVSVLAFNSDDPSLSPAEVCILIVICKERI